MRLLLASTSRYRRELLDRLGLPFECASPGVDEAPAPGEAPEALALRLARAKAAAVAATIEGPALVIGSDQCLALDGRIVGKPGTVEAACTQLAASSGRRVRFHTAVAIRSTAEGRELTHLDATDVVFRALDDDTIRRYVERERPLDCAGSFRSEGLGIALFERIDSADPTALVGLPLIATARMLRALGLDPLARRD
jgi:septum formation protein